jgi:hypothetical protein
MTLSKTAYYEKLLLQLYEKFGCWIGTGVGTIYSNGSDHSALLTAWELKFSCGEQSFKIISFLEE